MAEKLRFTGFFVRARIFPICSRICCALSIAHGSEPSAPASAAAATSSQSMAPAIGAWTIGSSILNNSIRRRSGHMFTQPSLMPRRNNAALLD